MKRHRDKWEPTAYSVLCSRHFEQSCFEDSTLLSLSLGLGKKKARLKTDAVPTLFSKPTSQKRKATSVIDPPPQKRRKSAAYEKRERFRVSFYTLFIITEVYL